LVACSAHPVHARRVIDRPQEKNATLLEPDGPVELAAGPAENLGDKIHRDQDSSATER
jgi:gamma-glutamylcysteine synthetase